MGVTRQFLKKTFQANLSGKRYSVLHEEAEHLVVHNDSMIAVLHDPLFSPLRLWQHVKR